VLCHLCFFKFDTCRFYVDKIHSATNVKEIESLETGLKVSLKMTFAESDIVKVREFLEEQYAIKTEVQQPTFMNMFTVQYIRRLRAVLVYQFFRQFSGINYFLFYAIKIFDDIGQNGAVANLVVALGYVFGTILCIWFVGALGRKTSIVGGIMTQSVALAGLIVMELTESYGLLYPTCVLYVLGFGAMAGVGGPWMVETIPSVGIGMGLGVQWFCTGLIGLITPLMTEKWPGPTGTMMFFTIWAIVGIFALDYVIIETKGKQTDEIEQDYVNFKYRPFRLCHERVAG
jgi:hypothetical protein